MVMSEWTPPPGHNALLFYNTCQWFCYAPHWSNWALWSHWKIKSIWYAGLARVPIFYNCRMGILNRNKQNLHKNHIPDELVFTWKTYRCYQKTNGHVLYRGFVNIQARLRDYRPWISNLSVDRVVSVWRHSGPVTATDKPAFTVKSVDVLAS